MPKPDPSRLRRTGVTVVAFNDAGQLLLHRRSDNGYWGLPGGSAELGETVAQVAVREAKEETGYDIQVVRLVGVYSDPATTTIAYPDGEVVSYVAICFQGRVIGGAPALSDETTAVDFFDPRNLPTPFFPNHIPRVQDALANQPAAFYR